MSTMVHWGATGFCLHFLCACSWDLPSTNYQAFLPPPFDFYYIVGGLWDYLRCICFRDEVSLFPLCLKDVSLFLSRGVVHKVRQGEAVDGGVKQRLFGGGGDDDSVVPFLA